MSGEMEQQKTDDPVTEQSLSELPIAKLTSIAEILGLDPNKANPREIINETLNISETLIELEDSEGFELLEMSIDLTLKKEAVAKIIEGKL